MRGQPQTSTHSIFSAADGAATNNTREQASTADTSGPKSEEELLQHVGQEASCYARRLGPNEEEDVQQDAICAVLEYRRRNEHVRDPGALANTIAKRRVIDHVKRQRRAPELVEPHDLSAVPAPERASPFPPLAELLEKLVKWARQVLTLRALGLSWAEVGAELDMSEEAARKRGTRAMQLMRETYPWLICA